MKNILFTNTARQERPFALTRHQVESLSSRAGRDVEAELRAMAGDAFKEKTFNTLVRGIEARLVLPAAPGLACVNGESK